jgi:phenylacetate-CoA ligase
MAISDKIYKYLPNRLQNIAISVFGYFWHKRRYGGVYKNELLIVKAREKLSREDWEAYQTTELRKILLDAFEHVPYYKEKFSNAGFTRDDFSSFELKDLHKLPFLEKDTLRRLGKSTLKSENINKNGDFFSSSGSTGTPVSIYFSQKFHQQWTALFEARVRNWAGVNCADARGMIGGRRVVPEGSDSGPFYRYNFVEKQVYYSAYHISPGTAANYVGAMWKYDIQYMTGYAVSNYLLALYIKQQGLKVPRLKAVITSSEKLTTEMRHVLEEVYQCNVFDGWSGVEACALVTECAFGSLHISNDAGIIELLDENGAEVAVGESGEVVCTGFLNNDQPLIRYRIGDRMTKGADGCLCGSTMPIVKEIDGRLEDVITGPDGRQMVRFHGIFIGIPAIEKSQVLQHSPNSIEIRIQNSTLLSVAELELIENRVKSQLGDVQVVVRQQATIEQTLNGKYKAVINLMKKM